jgi:predicted phosphoribosyltransferase
VCPLQPADFVAVGQWYRHFDQTTDDEVVRLLAASR